MREYQNRERKANRSLSTMQVLEHLQADAPAAFDAARIVGRWVWLEFASKPNETIRAAIKELGFHWNRKRAAWQHPCGFFTHHSPGDPREKYGMVRADEVLAGEQKVGAA